MSFEDKEIVCVDCGSKFTFTAGEQEFYQKKGFDNEPKRCLNCRNLRKKEKGNHRPPRKGPSFRES